jgi:hypothetical protein
MGSGSRGGGSGALTLHGVCYFRLSMSQFDQPKFAPKKLLIKPSKVFILL